MCMERELKYMAPLYILVVVGLRAMFFAGFGNLPVQGRCCQQQRYTPLLDTPHEGIHFLHPPLLGHERFPLGLQLRALSLDHELLGLQMKVLK